MFGTINGVRLAAEANNGNPGSPEGLLIVVALSLVVCLGVGVSLAQAMESRVTPRNARWVFGGILFVSIGVPVLCGLMIWNFHP